MTNKNYSTWRLIPFSRRNYIKTLLFLRKKLVTDIIIIYYPDIPYLIFQITKSMITKKYIRYVKSSTDKMI